MGFVKASITNLKNGANSKSGITLNCHFNPSEIKSSKKNTWSVPAVGENAAFTGGGNFIHNLVLYFDTYVLIPQENPHDSFSISLPQPLDFLKNMADQERPKPQSDVTEITKTLWEMMKIIPSENNEQDPSNPQGKPPNVRFSYGEFSYQGVITSLTETLTLFLEDGTPVRSKVEITIESTRDDDDLPNQNPSSGGKGGERAWVVKAGDTITSLAYQAYGDSTQWRTIAEANDLHNPRHLEIGRSIIIPPE